jgi:hypothetical protein
LREAPSIGPAGGLPAQQVSNEKEAYQPEIPGTAEDEIGRIYQFPPFRHDLCCPNFIDAQARHSYTPIAKKEVLIKKQIK